MSEGAEVTLRENLAVLAAICRTSDAIPLVLQAVESAGVPVHHLLRDWLYGGDVWHPLLMDLSLFILAVSGALWMLLHG